MIVAAFVLVFGLVQAVAVARWSWRWVDSKCTPEVLRRYEAATQLRGLRGMAAYGWIGIVGVDVMAWSGITFAAAENLAPRARLLFAGPFFVGAAVLGLLAVCLQYTGHPRWCYTPKWKALLSRNP